MAKLKKGTREASKKAFEEKSEEKRPFEVRHNCLICGKPGPDTICAHCKNVVQAEALEKKRKLEK